MKTVRFIVCILVVAMLLAVVLTSCQKEEDVENNLNQEGNLYTIINSENYYLFKTKEAEVYLEFLENLDTTNFEIVDITTSMHAISGTHGVSNEFYMITYKKIAE